MSIVAITTSINYHDILPYIIDTNKNYFDAWYIVISEHDKETKKIVEGHNTIIPIYYDFEISKNRFNKGKGVKIAQQKAYLEYPNSWYLLLDSDISLTEEFQFVKDNIRGLKDEHLYGCKYRRNFSTSHDYKNNINYEDILQHNMFAGFFQLYNDKKYYQDSNDASACDISFRELFCNRVELNGIIARHLGESGCNWLGRKIGSDFK